jgi:hypothetical protein
MSTEPLPEELPPAEPAFTEYEVPGIGTVIDPQGEPGYRVRLPDGQVTAYPAANGTPCEANAAADIAAAIAIPPPPPADCSPVGTRRDLTRELPHAEVSTLPGQTLLGIMPWGWAPANFNARIGEAFDAGSTISCGTVSTPARYVDRLPVSAKGFVQRTPLELKPMSSPSGTPIYIMKNAATTKGDIIKACLIIERIYLS